MQSNGQLMMVMVQPMCFGAEIACLEEVGIQKDQELSGVTFKIVNLSTISNGGFCTQFNKSNFS